MDNKMKQHYEVGIIGVGTMGSSLAGAMSSVTRSIIVSNRTMAKAEELSCELSISYGENRDVARSAEIIILGVKPQNISDVISHIAPVLAERRARGESFCLVSMAAGVALSQLREMTAIDCPIIRIMPNTPISVGSGTVLCCTENDGKEYLENKLVPLLKPCGNIVMLDEKLFNAGTALSGCAPAFVDIFIDALSDGGVRCGLTRDVAKNLAVSTLLGSAMLALESNKHPCVLRDEVTSPAGSTIEGVAVLERGAFRALVSDAVVACEKRSSELSKG